MCHGPFADRPTRHATSRKPHRYTEFGALPVLLQPSIAYPIALVARSFSSRPWPNSSITCESVLCVRTVGDVVITQYSESGILLGFTFVPVSWSVSASFANNNLRGRIRSHDSEFEQLFPCLPQYLYFASTKKSRPMGPL